MLSVGRHSQPGCVVLGVEAMNDALVAAVAADRRNDVSARAFFADDDDVSAVWQPFGMADLGV